VLVGKGITFDTGGLDIKPADGMLAMKTDMSGSGIVLAVLAACRELGVQVKVTGLLALAENAVGGASYRPSDVITQYGGTTVEIGNTDAEGRLVMADALAYADLTLDPTILLDIATLTGAARVALGRSMAPVYATDDALTTALVRAGETTGELLWSRTTGPRSTARLRTSTTSRAVLRAAGRSRQHCSCASSWAHVAGRTSTSPGWDAPTSTVDSSPRAGRASVPACCSPGSRRWHERGIRLVGAVVAAGGPCGRGHQVA
jgi:hypothetical protein